jgi:hypothetical protein
MALKTQIRKLYVVEEATFGVDPSASGSTYAYLHGETSLPKFGNEVHKYPAQNDRLAQSAPIIGAQKATFDLKIPLRASGTPSAPPATPAIATEVDLLLKHLLGAVTRGQSTAVGGGNASQTNILVTSSTGFTVGMVIFCSALGSFHYVQAVPDGTHVTVAPQTASVVTTGNLIAPNFYTPADTGHKTLAFTVFVDTVEITMLGCRATSGKLAGVGANNVPMLEMAFEADSYSFTTKASLPAPNDLFAAVRPPILKGAPFWIDSTKTVIAGLDFDFGVKGAFLPATEGTQGRTGYEVVDREAKGAIQPYYASGFLTDFQAGTDRVLAIGWGDGSPATINGGGLWIPKGRFLEPELDARGDVLGQKVPFGAFDNGTSPEFGLSLF